jgi:hypothetical protein
MATWTQIANMALAMLAEPQITDFDTDATNPGIICRAWHEIALDDALREWPWISCLKRAELTESSTTLTGSIDPDGTVNVVGVGTLFLTELEVGDRILVTGETREVATITNNTHLTVTLAFSDTANDASPERYDSAEYGYSYQFDLPTDNLRVIHVEDENDYLWGEEAGYLLTNNSAAKILYIARPASHDPTNLDTTLSGVIAAKLAQLIALPITGDINKFNAAYAMYQRMLADAKTKNLARDSETKFSLADYRF